MYVTLTMEDSVSSQAGEDRNRHLGCRGKSTRRDKKGDLEFILCAKEADTVLHATIRHREGPKRRVLPREIGKLQRSWNSVRERREANAD